MLKKFLYTVILSALLTANSALCDGIRIPGYDVLHFKAGKIEQEVFFRNPEENICSFKMSLILANGLPLWIADDVLNPGEVFLKIDLEHELKRGIYPNAVLKYECYDIEGGYRLNGAEIRVTIEAN